VVVLVIVHIFDFIPAFSQWLPYTPISHEDVVVLVVLIVLIVLVVPLDALQYVFCLPGMIRDIVVLKMGVCPQRAPALICHPLLPRGVTPEPPDPEDVCHPWQGAMPEGHHLCGGR